MSQNDSMIYNFQNLEVRVLNTLNKTKATKKLKSIKGPTLCVGSGGSNVVAAFVSQVLTRKNNCFCKIQEPRDALHEKEGTYKNIFVCSYSGNNHGVNVLENLNSKKYLLTYGEKTASSFIKIKCNSSLEKEMSFISLGATLMPMAILLDYYLESDTQKFITNTFSNCINKRYNIPKNNLPFDLISGEDTITIEKYLDSTFAEGGLSPLTIHKKYDYCHGRSTLSYKEKRNLIYLISKRNELDTLLLNLLEDKYESIIVLEGNNNDDILNNFELTAQAMYLTKQIAEYKNIDLSIIEYNKPLCKILYKYTGEM